MFYQLGCLFIKIISCIILLFGETFANTVDKQFLPADTAKVDKLNKQAWELRNNDIETAKSLAFQALQLAGKLNYKLGKSYSYNILGHYYKVKGAYDSALEYYNQSLAIRTQLRDTLNIIRSMRNVMSINKLMGDNTAGISVGLKALALCAKASEQTNALVDEKGWLQTNIAAIYLNLGNTSEALRYALEGKKIFNKTQNMGGFGAILLTLGNIYEEQQLYKKALEYYHTAEKIAIDEENERELAKVYNNIGNIYFLTNREEDALSYYLKSFDIRKKEGFDNDMAGSIFNMGAIYENKGQYDKAEEYYLKSLSQYTLAGDAEGKFDASYALGKIMYVNKKYNLAVSHYIDAYAVAQASGHIIEKIEASQALAEVYKKIPNADSALRYLELSAILRDSVNKQTFQFIELNARVKEKEQELTLAKTNNKLQLYVIIFLSVTAMFIATLAYTLHKRNKAKRMLLELKNKISEYELTTVDALMEGQENERQRLAIELHDTIGSILSAAKYAFKSMENSLEKLLNNNSEQYLRINAMLDEALENVRKISHDMASGVLKDVGLKEAFEKLCDTIGNAGNIKISLYVYGFDEEIEYSKALHLYRIVQELLTNVLKHAQSNNVTIQVIKTGNNINLTVEDDGRGFNKSGAAPKGIGLKNIEKRVGLLNGTWNVDTGKGKGTTTIIDVPVN